MNHKSNPPNSFAFLDLLVGWDQSRDIVARNPDLQPILDELDALFAAQHEYPPPDWQAPTARLQAGIDLAITSGQDPSVAQIRYYRAWRVRETDRGRSLLRALERGVRAAGYLDPF